MDYFESASFHHRVLLNICLLCPGLLSALIEMGGYEHIDPVILTKGNTIFYIVASITAFFCAPIIHLLGPRIALFIGCLTYVLYTGSLLGYFYLPPATFYNQELLLIIGSGVLGIGSSLYWVTQAALLLSYSNEFEKGTCFSQMWDAYSTGGMIGGFVYLGINYTATTSLHFSAFISIMVLMFSGALLALAIKDFPKIMIAENIPVKTTKDTTLLHELIGLLKILFNFKLLLLIPFFICTNWGYIYHSYVFNARLFNPRTRGLNKALYWCLQATGATNFGKNLDNANFSKRTMAFIGLAWIFITSMCVWGGGYAAQLAYPNTNQSDWIQIDLKEYKYIGLLFLYMFYGSVAGELQVFAYWFIGAQSNNATLLIRYSGFFIAFQYTGSAIAYALSNYNVDYLAQLVTSWVVVIVALVFGGLVVLKLPGKYSLDTECDFVDSIEIDER